MSSTAETKGGFVTQIAHGWSEAQPQIALSFLSKLQVCLSSHTEQRGTLENGLSFVLDLSQIRLKGMGEVHCRLTSGSSPVAEEGLLKYYRGVVAPGRVIMIFAASQPAHEAAVNALAGTSCVVIGPAGIRDLLESKDPISLMRQALRERIPIGSLSPYSILLSAEGNMFYGRTSELRRLRDEETVSFGLVGPGRIGKTSLVKEYRRSLVRARNPLTQATFYVDFLDAPEKTPSGYVRHLALAIENSNRSYRTTPEDLSYFLKYQSSRLGFILNLLLDEVDDVCANPEVIQALAHAAREGFVRLVMSGKGNLLKVATDPGSHLAERLELMRLPPLDETAAMGLILEPLSELGIRIQEQNQVVRHILRMTGCAPHLIQLYLSRLIESVLESKTRDVTQTHLDRLRWDFELAQYAVSPLQELKDPQAKALAKSLLQEAPATWTPRSIQGIAERQGLKLEIEQTISLCNQLVINHILTWKQGNYTLANEALRFYAEQLGLIGNSAAG